MYIIGGKFKKKGLIVPKTDAVRPTTAQMRESLFNICQNEIEGAEFLDLFAGSGAMGLEALSRGARHATFVEKNRLALAAIRKNIASLRVEEETTLWAGELFKILPKLVEKGKKYDLIYADPPYGEGFGSALLLFLDANPLLSAGGTLFIEDSSLEIPPLNHLSLHNQRRLGKGHLFQFIKS